jgi:hypothetical protein
VVAQVPELWSAYRDAAGGLSAATLAAEAAPSLDESAVDEMLARSDALTGRLIEHLGADAAAEREMAALQLQAAAAVDIDRANALAAIDAGEAPEAVLADEHQDVIDRILSTPTESGIAAVLHAGEGGFFATASGPGTLNEAVSAAVDAIANDAERAAGTTVKGLTGAMINELTKGLGDGVEKVFEQLRDGVSWLKYKAVLLVLKAVQKLLAVFGAKTASASKKVEEWIAELTESRVIHLLQRLYKVDQLKQRYKARIEGAPGGVSEDRDSAARNELRTLQAKWHMRTDVIDAIGGIAAYARKWILGLSPPAGLIAYTTGFALATGYVVFAGGDYLDWREDGGILDLVEGVGAIVDRATGTGAG